MLVEQPLATFVDRHTMVYERTYPHAIDLVWEAVSTGEHLDVWMLPESRVERRVGGRCAFGWGSPADDPAASTGEVTVFEPPTTIQYTFEGANYMRFDLAGDGELTTLRFTLHFRPPAGAAADDPDLPAAPGTAWRPGFLAGYHQMLGELDQYLAGGWTAEDRAHHLEEMAAARPDDEHLRLIEVYRGHVAATCPPG